MWMYVRASQAWGDVGHVKAGCDICCTAWGAAKWVAGAGHVLRAVYHGLAGTQDQGLGT